MKSCLGYIMLIDDNWVSLSVDDVNTGRVFFKQWYSTLESQLRSRDYLKANVEEVRLEKMQAL
jgi:hypothetical protein